MKAIYTTLIALLCLGFVSCKDKKGQQWDPNAMISLRAGTAPQGAPSRANPEHLSPLEIVQQTNDMWFINKEGMKSGRGFAEAQRDYTTPKLLMWGTDIIMEGKYVPNFIESTDVILTSADLVLQKVKDTIAYIPNSVLRTAQPKIKAAFDSGDFETVYALFDQAFVFYPITGAEWKVLKEQGAN